MVLQESGQMYLETILILSEKNGQVRSIDISEYMEFSKPSVSRAMRLLKGSGYIEIDKDGFITLTESGAYIANQIYERHKLLTRFLKHLGVSDETASSDACRLEHNLSNESFEAMKRYVKKYNI